VLIVKQLSPPYESTICNNLEYQELEQQILRQKRDLTEAENTAKNLLTALTGLSVEIRKTTKKASILAGQLKKASLSLIIVKKEKTTITPKNECTICYLITLRTRDSIT